MWYLVFVFFFKQKTAYEVRISDWSSDVCSSDLDDAYRVLGVPASASDAEVKKAYRRLMSQNHPDKLAAKGLPESMREMAEQKTREITAAYELVERSRGR